ncbi:MAG: fructosamine kinase family protein [Kineosporiaceae bacterium]
MTTTPGDPHLALLAQRLTDAGLPAEQVRAAPGGFATVAGFAHLRDGRDVFAKTAEGPGEGAFAGEADGLVALARAGLPTPAVLAVRPDLLVLERLRPVPEGDDAFWERLGRTLAAVHASTEAPRFGWHRTTWLGRLPQDNTWDDDGFAFFARRRLLRWLPEPRVRAKLDDADRAALERLCERLPELLPPRPACLVHGDLWAANVLAGHEGAPAVVDPAVSFTWAEVDLAHLCLTPGPPGIARAVAAYAEAAGLDDGWRDRLPLIQLRQHLTLMAQYDDDWGSTEATKALLAPFRASAQ